MSTITLVFGLTEVIEETEWNDQKDLTSKTGQMVDLVALKAALGELKVAWEEEKVDLVVGAEGEVGVLEEGAVVVWVGEDLGNGNLTDIVEVNGRKLEEKVTLFLIIIYLDIGGSH